MKKNRTNITDLKPTTVIELDDEQLAQSAGGSTEFGTTSYTASWGCMDVDKPQYDAAYD